jgi:hypothetical protein
MLSHRSLLGVALALAAVGCFRAAARSHAGALLPASAFSDVPPRDLARFRVRDSVHRAELLDTLAAQERLWRLRRPASYEYGILRTCGCFGDLWYHPYQVRVSRSGSEVRDSLGRVVTRDAGRTALLGIDGLFAGLREQIRSGTPYIQITYDLRFGYPDYSLTGRQHESEVL